MALDMPDNVRDSVLELRRTRSHEGRRRQLQYVGKMMRRFDAEPLREAVAQLKLGPARDSLKFHEAERWREELMADDDGLTRWVQAFPETDVQQLRSLVRQARLQRLPEAHSGQSQRQGRAYRDLFRVVTAGLDASAAEAPEEG
jgi:ribosome-associated protein